MTDYKNINLSSLLMGLCVGSILGVSVALLFAPKRGRKLREDINVVSKEAIEKSRSLAQDVADTSTEIKDEVVDYTRTVAEDTKSRSKDIKKKFKQ